MASSTQLAALADEEPLSLFGYVQDLQTTGEQVLDLHPGSISHVSDQRVVPRFSPAHGSTEAVLALHWMEDKAKFRTREFKRISQQVNRR